MASRNKDRVWSLLRGLSDNLQTLLPKLSEGAMEEAMEEAMDGGEGSGFEEESFRKQLEECSQLISQDATKLSLSCHQHPFPLSKDMLSVTESIQNHHTFLTSITLTYLSHHPLDNKTSKTIGESHHIGNSYCFGKTLSKCVQSYATSVIQGTIDLLTSLTSPHTQKHLQCTGMVWEVTKSVKELPKYNHEAVRLDLQTSLDLLTDAFQEFNEAIQENEEGKEDGDEGDDEDEEDEDDAFQGRWTPQEMDTVQSALGLMKTSRAVLMMIIKQLKSLPSPPPPYTLAAEGLGSLSLEDAACPAHLDDFPPLALKLVSTTDDFTSSLYSPILSSIPIQINALSETLICCLASFRSCMGEGGHGGGVVEIQGVHFMLKAVHHNTNKCLSAVEKYNYNDD